MKEAKASIDPFRSATEQIDDIVKKINMIMPIKFATVKIEVTIPPEFANRSYGTLKRYGLKSEKWLITGACKPPSNSLRCRGGDPQRRSGRL